MTSRADRGARALGIRVKSGWAAAVLLERAEELSVVDVRRIELADPMEPASYQPYHGGRGQAQTDQRVIDRLIDLIGQRTRAAIRALVAEHRAGSREPGGAVVVQSSRTDPATIANPHIRIHALEGQLFPRLVLDALAHLDLPAESILERELWDAAPAFSPDGADPRAQLAALGRPIAGPWRADQKVAALAAWWSLAGRPRPKTDRRTRPS